MIAQLTTRFNRLQASHPQRLSARRSMSAQFGIDDGIADARRLRWAMLVGTNALAYRPAFKVLRRPVVEGTSAASPLIS